MKLCTLRGAGILGAGIFLEACASPYYYAQASMSDGVITLFKTEFVGEKEGQAYQRRFLLVDVNLLEYPICIYRFSDDNYVALYTKCMHQGCKVKPQEDYLVCPCHGSEYDNKGKVINPPADRDLERFVVTTDSEHIVIHLQS